MRRLGVSLSLALLLASPVAAFEGILDARLTTTGGGGLGEIWLTEDGSIRADIPIPDPITGSQLKTTLLVRTKKPDGMAYVVHNTRMWDRYSLSAPVADAERYEVKRIDEPMVLEQQTTHVVVTDTKSGDIAEVWLAKDMGSLELLDRVIRKAVRYAGSVHLALKAKGIDGFPLKMRFKKRSNGNEFLLEVININAKKLDRAGWKIPSGYNRQALPGSPFADESTKKSDPLGDAAKNLGNLFGR